jgi:hypothetical protein
MRMRAHSIRLALLFAVASSSACRFTELEPTVRAPAEEAGPTEVFSTALETARALGYRSTEIDEPRRVANGVVLGANTNYLLREVKYFTARVSGYEVVTE